ncbi:DRTGG domain-containing protein [Chloroflexota bacterium]
MVALYITSSERGSGKTTICAGLGKHLLNDGKKIGFFKPIIADSKKPPMEAVTSDAAFIKNLLALEEPVDLLCPVFHDESNLKNNLKEAYNKVSRNKDIILVEGVSDHNQATREIAEMLGARVIIVESYSKPTSKVMDRYQGIERNLLGVVVNKVPVSRLEQVQADMSTQLGKAGVNILGILPEDRALFALTIGELAAHIQGEILCGAEKSADLVENVMLGAMCVDPGPDYFGRKANKAVIVRGERPDMQMAALETSTRCLVLTGGIEPKPVVLFQAGEKNIPVILAQDDTTTVVKNIEDALSEISFSQDNKLPKLSEIMERNFDFQAVYKGLGLAS